MKRKRRNPAVASYMEDPGTNKLVGDHRRQKGSRGTEYR